MCILPILLSYYLIIGSVSTFAKNQIFDTLSSLISVPSSFPPFFLLHLLRLWLIGGSVFMHQLGKLADMINLAAYLRMIFVDKAASALPFVPCLLNYYLSAIGNPKFLRIVWPDKTDSLPCIAHMPVKMLRHVTIDIKVSHGGTAPYQIGLSLRIYTEAALPAVLAWKHAVCKFPRILCHIPAQCRQLKPTLPHYTNRK